MPVALKAMRVAIPSLSSLALPSHTEELRHDEHIWG